MSNIESWENGELGCTEEYVAPAPVGTSAAVDDALGLQLISIRLQKQLIGNLKAIAEHHGIGYQPMIRDLLNRFVDSEMQQILVQRLAELKEEEATREQSFAPVNDFLERQRA